MLSTELGHLFSFQKPVSITIPYRRGDIRVQKHTKYCRFYLLSQATSTSVHKRCQGQFSGPAENWNLYVCLNCILLAKQAGLGLS